MREAMIVWPDMDWNFAKGQMQFAPTLNVGTYCMCLMNSNKYIVDLIDFNGG